MDRLTHTPGDPQQRQPEITHRLLTADEARAIWAILSAAALPEDCQEVRIELPPDNGPQARGWVVYTSGTGADLTLRLNRTEQR